MRIHLRHQHLETDRLFLPFFHSQPFDQLADIAGHQIESTGQPQQLSFIFSFGDAHIKIFIDKLTHFFLQIMQGSDRRRNNRIHDSGKNNTGDQKRQHNLPLHHQNVSRERFQWKAAYEIPIHIRQVSAVEDEQVFVIGKIVGRVAFEGGQHTAQRLCRAVVAAHQNRLPAAVQQIIGLLDLEASCNRVKPGLHIQTDTQIGEGAAVRSLQLRE
ncbi:hypothetical protein D3C76_845460 [compost metagenome]